MPASHDPTPKRDPRLSPLSRDHQEALARAREATLAVDGGAPHDAASLARLAARCAAYFERELDAHFRREERHLLPLTVARFGRDDDLVTRVRQDHSMIRKLTRRLTDPEDQAPLMGRLAAWAKAVADHVRFEEHEWYEALQNALPQAELERLARLLAEPPPAPKAPKRVPKKAPKKAAGRKAPAKRKTAAKEVRRPGARKTVGTAAGKTGGKAAGETAPGTRAGKRPEARARKR